MITQRHWDIWARNARTGDTGYSLGLGYYSQQPYYVRTGWAEESALGIVSDDEFDLSELIARTMIVLKSHNRMEWLAIREHFGVTKFGKTLGRLSVDERYRLVDHGMAWVEASILETEQQ